MTRINFSDHGHTPFEQLIGYHPEVLNRWKKLEEVFWAPAILDNHLKEQVRRAMAFENGCEYCMVKGGRPNFNKEELRISMAIGFAGLFCRDHHSITNAHFNILKEHFTDAEISALCAFVSFIDAAQKLGKVFNLTEVYQQDPVIKLSEL